jgi:2-furoyl-CoA dehydrogenase FAD binding subunit
MKPPAFDYVAPTSVPEVLDLLSEYGSDARILAGGQTLGPMLNMRMLNPAIIVDINNVTGLDRLEKTQSFLQTGALVRQRHGLEHATIRATQPLLARALKYVGHYQTRTRGTLCGSIAHGDPTAELPLVLLVLNGTVSLRSKKKARTVKASDFFQGALTTTRQPDELITSVQWPLSLPGELSFFEEITAGHTSIASCAVALRLSDGQVIQSFQLGVTAVSDRPLLIDTADLLGQVLTSDLTTALAQRVQSAVPAVEDLHASAAYRRHVIGWVVRKILMRATDCLGEAG